MSVATDWSFRTPQAIRWPSRVSTCHFKNAQVSCGIKLRFHDLRHTSVALAIAGGAHPKAIQARMGHSSIAGTLDRYGHLLPSLDAVHLASGERGSGSEDVLDPVTFAALQVKAGVPTGSKDGRLEP